jgi:cold shock protein
MGDKKHHRDHRRRHEADDYDPSYRLPDFRPRPPTPVNTTRSSEPVAAVVKWFDSLKGFGFVKVEDGSEAFLHVSRLKSAGYNDDLPEGSQITVRLGPGKRGTEVTELVEVSAAGSSRSPKQASGYQRSSAPDIPEEELVGSVKWYNSDKGFGFVAVGTGRKDVFVSGRVLERNGLNGLPEGRRVKMKVVQGHKGPEARSIQFLD